MKRYLTSLINVIWLASSLVACGAANKDASQVAGMFSGASKTLDERVESVCNSLRRRKKAPSTSDFDLAILDKCEGAGENAINVKNYDGFRLQQYSIGNGAETDKQRSSFRLQLWFNSTLIGLASLANNLSDLRDTLGSEDIPIDAEDLANAAKVDMKIIDKLALNLDGDIYGGMGLNFTVDGLAKLDMDIRVDFTVIKNSVAVVIKSDKAEGVISDLFMVIMVTPYANDTYLDMIGSIKIGDILSDSKVIDSLLPTMTEKLLNGLFKLDGQRAAKAKTSQKGVVDKVKSTGSTGVAA